MKFKKSMRKAWTGLTSEKAKVGYMKVGIALKTSGQVASKYFRDTNRELDRIVGTRDPNPGKLTGVAVPRGYQLVRIKKKGGKRR